jgi:hypothetical protein
VQVAPALPLKDSLPLLLPIPSLSSPGQIHSPASSSVYSYHFQPPSKLMLPSKLLLQALLLAL